MDQTNLSRAPEMPARKSRGLCVASKAWFYISPQQARSGFGQGVAVESETNIYICNTFQIPVRFLILIC